jgi:(2Fe-2S) ferredoxin
VIVREDKGAPRSPLAPENFQLMGWVGEYHYSEMSETKLARVVNEHIRCDRPAEDLVCVAEEALPLVKVAK